MPLQPTSGEREHAESGGLMERRSRLSDDPLACLIQQFFANSRARDYNVITWLPRLGLFGSETPEGFAYRKGC